jgi:formate dehydrogenase subunit delta
MWSMRILRACRGTIRVSGTQLQHLVKMASQIALNLGAGRDDMAAAGRTADHILRFWTPAMRKRLLEHWRRGEQLPAVVAAALRQIDEDNSNEVN